MLPLWGWIVKLCSGFLPISGEKVGKIIWVMVWIVLALTVYHKVFYSKQNVTQIEKVEKQYVYQTCPGKDNFVGIKLWKLQLGLSL